nr:hypothetical protein [Tanacetum cinerariifolium]
WEKLCEEMSGDIIPSRDGSYGTIKVNGIYNHEKVLKMLDQARLGGYYRSLRDVCSLIDDREEDQEHLMFRLRGIEKRKARKECLKEVRNTKAKGSQGTREYSRNIICLERKGASSRLTNLVVDETVYKVWEDRMERPITIASWLEAEQDNGNKNRTQSIETLNEPLP